MLLKSQKGSGVAKGLLSREGAHFLGWDMNMENEGLQAVILSCHLSMSFMFSVRPYPRLGFPCQGGV
jgi:hypothetical protein